ncbi:MAG TPA: LLM class flavin-dependent oxidoreductase [Acidimicrobiia bacterium]
MSALPSLGVGFPPGPRIVELARRAEELGYARVWLFDSAGLYEDVWMWLALTARETSIPLGTAVLVPNLRHVMTTAAAISTLEGLAPGRTAYGFGTGATARWVLGKGALSWATTRRYIETLRALLRGEVVEIDGARTQMLHHADLAVSRPIVVPLLLSAVGPKGQEIAREIADGIIKFGGGVEGFDRCVSMMYGTVLDPGEDLMTPRVREAVGPWYVLAYHGTWQMAGEAVDGLPLGRDWRAAIEAERPEGERHLAVHEGHVTHVVERDRAVLDAAGDGVAGFGWIGTPDELRARAEAAAASGVTELLYTPSGPDLDREMGAFMAALRHSSV